MKERERQAAALSLSKPPACWWLNFSAVAPSCGETDELHLSLQDTGTNQNIYSELSTRYFFLIIVTIILI